MAISLYYLNFYLINLILRSLTLNEFGNYGKEFCFQLQQQNALKLPLNLI